MLNKNQAKKLLGDFYPEAKIVACSLYKNLYLFRVEHPSEIEKDWDPFFSVNTHTGEVREFSILTDGNRSEISKLDWQDV